ncbi:MAG TPA: EamA family transporter [Magnetospirillum sp.]|jgi:O-acetylserine/cysteine efflux transporter|nr:EamA family transporter [Magnetospirillum sp.]
MNARDLLTALLVVILWGLNFIAVKTALTVLPPFLLTSLRFALVALALAPFHRPRLKQLPAVAGIGLVLGCGHFGLLFLGISGMEAATAAIVTQLGVPFSALLAWAFFGERLGPARALGLSMAFAGVALLAGEPTLPHWGPLAVGVLSMACWALSNVQVKRLGEVPPLALNGWMALFAAPMLLALSLGVEYGQTDALVRAATEPRVLVGVAYTVIASSLVAYTLWYRLLARHSMNRVVPITLLGPVVGVAGGVLVLGESLTWHKLVGGALTIAGVAAVQLVGGMVPPKDEPEPGT